MSVSQQRIGTKGRPLNKRAGLIRPARQLDKMRNIAWTLSATGTMVTGPKNIRITAAGNAVYAQKLVTGLTIGQKYRAIGDITFGPGVTQVLFIVSTVTPPTGDVVMQPCTLNTSINTDFTATATSLYVCIMQVTATAGLYTDISKNFRLIPVA